jgi:hypothetical protein
MPLTSDMVKRLDDMALAQKRKISNEPVFRFGSQQVEITGDVSADRNAIEIVDPPLHDHDTTERYHPEIPPESMNVMDADDLIQLPAAQDDRGDGDDIDEITPHPAVSLPVPLQSSPEPVAMPVPPEPDPPSVPVIVRPMQESSLNIGPDVSSEERLHRYDTRYKGKRPPERQYEYGLHITVKKALDKFGKVALRPIEAELQQMLDKGVFEPVRVDVLSPAQRKNIIRSSIFLKEKFLSTGEFEKLKARLVGGGDMQDRSLYPDVSSPTVSNTAVFLVAAIAAREKRVVATVDIGGAYLNASMTAQEVLMRINAMLSGILVNLDPHYKRFLCKDGTIVVRLKKALYGCVESGQQWYTHLSSTLHSMGFKANAYEPCVFNKDGDDGNQCTICIYVDDLLVTCASAGAVKAVLNQLQDIYKDVKIHEGKIHSYLGMTIDFSVDEEVSISMEGYTDELLRFCDISADDAAASPAGAHLFSITESKSLENSDKEWFHTVVAKLLFLGKRTRPELLTGISFLSSRVRECTEEDRGKLYRMLKYLNSSKNLGLVLKMDDDMRIRIYIDSSHGVHIDGRGHSGVNISAGRGSFYAKSVKQKLATKSSSESELVGVSDGLSQGIWARNFMISQGYVNIKPLLLYQDNQSTIAMMRRGRSTSERTRHIDQRYFFIKDRIEAKEVEISYLSTGEMIADILSKPLQGELFRKLRGQLSNHK